MYVFLPFLWFRSLPLCNRPVHTVSCVCLAFAPRVPRKWTDALTVSSQFHVGQVGRVSVIGLSLDPTPAYRPTATTLTRRMRPALIEALTQQMYTGRKQTE